MYDLVVIGGGPAGYVCCIKAAQLGMKVACIEKKKFLGGTCLNEGCIPSKTLLHATHLYKELTCNAGEFGIDVKKSSVVPNITNMMKKKEKVISQLASGIDSLFLKNKIKRFLGVASIEEAGIVNVVNGKNVEVIKAKNIVIATGSVVRSLPNIKIDEEKILSSTGALELKSIPKSMVVVGGGVIGLELGSVWKRLGCEVTVVEFAPAIVPSMDKEISKSLLKILQDQGLTFHVSHKVSSVKVSNKSVTVDIESTSGGDIKQLKVEKVLISVGRIPCISGIGLEKIGVKLDKQGFVSVNSNFETNISGVFAIGDVLNGQMLAHKAEEDGVAVAEILSGQCAHVPEHIPSVMYTSPEVASIGKTEEQLKGDGIKYKVGKFPFLGNSRAHTTGETSGFVKTLTDASNDTILGVHIVGPQAGTLINEVSVAMAYKATAEDVARICHSHPDYNEAIRESAMDAWSKALHK